MIFLKKNSSLIRSILLKVLLLMVCQKWMITSKINIFFLKLFSFFGEVYICLYRKFFSLNFDIFLVKYLGFIYSKSITTFFCSWVDLPPKVMTPIIPPFANSKMPPTKFVVPCTNEILLPPFEIEILL
jgi:hypothetical protein